MAVYLGHAVAAREGDALKPGRLCPGEEDPGRAGQVFLYKDSTAQMQATQMQLLQTGLLLYGTPPARDDPGPAGCN